MHSDPCLYFGYGVIVSAVEELIDVYRPGWSPRTARQDGLKPKDPATRTKIEVHHGGPPLKGKDPVEAWKSYLKYHVNNKKWVDIWYNLGIHPDGRLFELRGAWRPNSARPYLTVNLPGNGDVDSTDAQFDTLQKLRVAFKKDTGSTEIGYHAERGGTICPGPVVINRIKQIRSEESSTGGIILPSEPAPVDEPVYPSATGPIVGPITVPGTPGYYVIGADGGVFTFGDAPFHGSVPGKVPSHDSLRDPIEGFAPYVLYTGTTPYVAGYYLMSRSGAVFAFGAAPWHGRVIRGN